MTSILETRKSNSIISISIITGLLILFLNLYYLDIFFDFTDFIWSVIFITVISIIYILRFISKENVVSLYSLFFLTSLLFLGGKFISVFLGYNGESLFELDFFVYTLLDERRSSKLFFTTISAFLSLEFGYYFSRIFFKRNDNNIYSYKLILNMNKYVLFSIIIIISLLLGMSSYSTVLKVLDGGYLALYVSQAEEYGFTYLALLKIILLASTGIFLAQKNKNIQTIFLFMMGLYFLIGLILGSRGGFITYLLFLLWYKHDFGLKKANLVKFLFIVLGLAFFLSSIFGLISLRVTEANQMNAYQRLLKLINDQGTTLMIFNESLYVDNYPIIPYFQNFIPGSSFIYSTFVSDIYPYDNSFGAYISYTLNPEAYNFGYGLGWSFFSDAYLYGFSTIILFCFWVAVFSIFINYLQINITKNIYIKIITISIVSPILFLPRSGLNAVFPLIPYILILFFLMKLLSGSLKR